jgi:hypothetical protein
MFGKVFFCSNFPFPALQAYFPTGPGMPGFLIRDCPGLFIPRQGAKPPRKAQDILIICFYLRVSAFICG